MSNIEYPYVEPVENSGEGYVNVNVDILYLDLLHSNIRLSNNDISQTGASFNTDGDDLQLNINMDLANAEGSNFMSISLSKEEAQALYKQLGASLDASEINKRWTPETMKTE